MKKISYICDWCGKEMTSGVRSFGCNNETYDPSSVVDSSKTYAWNRGLGQLTFCESCMAELDTKIQIMCREHRQEVKA